MVFSVNNPTLIKKSIDLSTLKGGLAQDLNVLFGSLDCWYVLFLPEHEMDKGI
jgi:hypothetical protein